MHQDLPKISYLTAIDRLFVTAYLFLGTKIGFMLILRHYADNKPTLAKRLDRSARWLFPLAYVAVNTTIIVSSLVQPGP